MRGCTSAPRYHTQGLPIYFFWGGGKKVIFSPESVESVVRPVDGEHGGPGVGLGHPPVALQDDHLHVGGRGRGAWRRGGGKAKIGKT